MCRELTLTLLLSLAVKKVPKLQCDVSLRGLGASVCAPTTLDAAI